MPYILNKTNGAKLVTVEDAALDNSTNLLFVGKNYAGYGEIVNENFLKLLENFSDSKEPSKPILGQIWFDSATKRLSVYDGKKFKGISHIQIKSSTPDSPVEGELWWDTISKQLKAYNGVEYKIIGPLLSSSRASWEFGEELQLGDTSNTTVPIIKGKIGNNTVAIVSNKSFDLRTTSELVSLNNASESFISIKRGLTLVGTNDVGSSKDSGVFLWGTASESLYSNTATNVISVDSSVDQFFNLPFVSTTSTARDSQIMVNDGLKYNPFTQEITIIAASARYADLAERYETDNSYDAGTVVVIGGLKEITVTHIHGDTAVLGVISTKPAYIMNSDAGNNLTHPCVALRGRVPCKVIGPVKKGDLLVTSSTPGYAEIMKSTDKSAALLGKSLQDFNGPKGIIEIII